MEADPAEWSTKRTYHFLTSAVAPRPIAWVTTVDPESGATNAAPFSWYQSVCAEPPLIILALAFRPGGVEKDTLRNIRAGGGFVVNIATVEQVGAVVATSQDLPAGTSELEAAGLATTPARRVKAPYIAASPVHLECELFETHQYGGDDGTTLVVGRIVYVHADDEVLDERGSVDPAKVTFLARLGGRDYAAIDETFEHTRPRQDDPVRS